MDERSTDSELEKRVTGGRCPRRIDCIDMLLIVSLVLSGGMLAGGLAWPSLVAWMNRPRAGVQQRMRLDATADKDRPAVAIDYLLYLPEGYGRGNRDWPLVVFFLHGAGERGNDLGKVGRSGPPGLVAEGRAFPFLLVSPQCPSDRRREPSALLRLIDHLAAR